MNRDRAYFAAMKLATTLNEGGTDAAVTNGFCELVKEMAALYGDVIAQTEAAIRESIER